MSEEEIRASIVPKSSPAITVQQLMEAQYTTIQRHERKLAEYEQVIVRLNEEVRRLGAEQRDSLGVLLMIANDQTIPVHLRLKAADAAADRQYPKLSANMSHATVKRFSYAERIDWVKAQARAKLTVHEGGGGPEAS
jgi:uncharacterized protein (UPF0147 family)